ncbi:MAG: FAD-binding oxidoreductase [Actinobacteria bacterium]|nr:MAG: FAD-binding oxidoreductase [Actinomycetota bacterium]
MTAKSDCVKIVGEESVLADKKILASFARDDGGSQGSPPACVVKPRSAEEVREIVLMANARGYALVPVSSGEPHSRGDTVPATEGAVIVDLSGMKRVLRMDRRNKVAMVEPGVTFGELRDAAAQEGLRVLTPLLPRPSKSVLGSALEREPMLIPKYHWDMTDPLMCVEVVFGTGDVFRTGSAAGPGTLEEQWAVGCAQKNPMGPGQTDFLRLVQGSQGSMGIVTWGTVKLELLPGVEKAFLVTADEFGALQDFAYTILKFKLPDLCLILNGAALGAITEKGGGDMPPWTLAYSISGYTYMPRERVEYLEKDVADIASAAGVKPARTAGDVDAGELARMMGAPCPPPHWKTRARGACREVFFLTTLDRVPAFLAAVDGEMSAHGFDARDLGVYVQPIRQGTGCHLEMDFFYDPGSEEDTRKARALHEGVSRACIEMGGFFSRPYGGWADLAYGRAPDAVAALARIKDILDPRGVMNPGRLCFGKEG